MASKKILVKSGTIVTKNERSDVLDNADVLIDGDRIAAIGANIEAPDAEILDAADMIVMPGMVDTHASLWWTVMRGGGFDLIGDEYLRHFLPTYRGRMRPQDVYNSMKAGALNLLANGVTTILAFTHCLSSRDHLMAAAGALSDSGVRACFGASVGDNPRGGYTDVSQRFADISQLGKDLASNPLMSVTVALTEMEHVAEERTMREIGFSRDNGFRMTMHCNREGHILELNRLKLLAPDILPVHCNRQYDEEFALMADNDISMAITPVNEFGRGRDMSGVGRAFSRGVRIALGNDLAAYARLDLFEQMRTLLALQGYFDHSQERHSQRMPVRRKGYPLFAAEDLLSMATRNGAHAVGVDAGVLEAGKLADVVLVSTRPFGRAVGVADRHIVQHAGAESVDTVIVGGRVAVRGGKLEGIDAGKLFDDLMWSREHMLDDELHREREEKIQRPALGQESHAI